MSTGNASVRALRHGAVVCLLLVSVGCVYTIHPTSARDYPTVDQTPVLRLGEFTSERGEGPISTGLQHAEFARLLKTSLEKKAERFFEDRDPNLRLDSRISVDYDPNLKGFLTWSVLCYLTLFIAPIHQLEEFKVTCDVSVLNVADVEVWKKRFVKDASLDMWFLPPGGITMLGSEPIQANWYRDMRERTAQQLGAEIIEALQEEYGTLADARDANQDLMDLIAGTGPAPPDREPGPGPAEPAPDSDLPRFSGRRHVLIVGISKYQDGSFAALERARRDAEDLANFLKSPEGGDIPSSRVHILYDQEATRANIINELIKMSRQAEADDLIILYMACHGRTTGQSHYIVPYDGLFNAPEGSLIDKSELARFLDKADAERQLVFLDCCFASGKDFVLRSGEVDDEAFKPLARKGRVVITSTKGSETALDSVGPNDRNSPFAAHLLKALSGESPEVDADGNGRITARELHSWLRPLVAAAARSRGQDMTPQIYGKLADEIEVLPMPDRP